MLLRAPLRMNEVKFARLKHLRWLLDLAKDRDFTFKLIKEDHFAYVKPTRMLEIFFQLQVHSELREHTLAVFRLFTCQRARGKSRQYNRRNHLQTSLATFVTVVVSIPQKHSDSLRGGGILAIFKAVSTACREDFNRCCRLQRAAVFCQLFADHRGSGTAAKTAVDW